MPTFFCGTVCSVPLFSLLLFVARIARFETAKGEGAKEVGVVEKLLAYSKGRKTEKKQSRLKFSIALENTISLENIQS